MQIRERTSNKQYLFPVQSFLAIDPNSIQVIVVMTMYLCSLQIKYYKIKNQNSKSNVLVSAHGHNLQSFHYAIVLQIISFYLP